LIAPAETAIDMTDYYFRQVAMQPATMDLTDYYFRHPGN